MVLHCVVVGLAGVPSAQLFPVFNRRFGVLLLTVMGIRVGEERASVSTPGHLSRDQNALCFPF